MRLAIEEPAACYRTSYGLQRRLRGRGVAHHPSRPPLILPARILADRLFCGCGELEDPIGAAADL